MPECVLIEKLTAKHLHEHPVWEYVNDEAVAPETAVRPVKDLPVQDLAGRVVGIRVRFHNGSQSWAILGNISLGNARLTKHFLCISIEKEGQWFGLARYHDSDSARRGPVELAEFLGLPISDIFPIEYDISQMASGDPSVIRGTVPERPDVQLTRDELIQLALEEG